MSITVEIKNVYGNKMVYPACETSKIFASIACQKTLSEHTIANIKELGYKIQVKTPSL